jgi:hypothetical protein
MNQPARAIRDTIEPKPEPQKPPINSRDRAFPSIKSRPHSIKVEIPSIDRSIEWMRTQTERIAIDRSRVIAP